MLSLARGQKVKLSDLTGSQSFTVGIGATASGLTFDISCFGVDENNKLSDDRYFVFYNQKSSPEGALRQLGANGPDIETFQVELGSLPASIRRLVFVLTLDGQGSLSQLQNGYFRLLASGAEVAKFEFSGNDFSTEKAIMVAEIYFKDVWRLAAVGQGFAGGLDAVLTHFGGQEVEEAAATPQAVAPAPVRAVEPAPSPSQPVAPAPSVNLKKIELEKKLEKQAPHLLSLAKTAQVTLEKKGLGDHTARVALCLDISISMSTLYAKGKIQRFAEKVLALGTRFDDDGAIDIFLFGAEAHDIGEMNVDNFAGFIGNIVRSYPLEGGTYYGRAIRAIRKHYFGSDAPRKSPLADTLPVYVMFLTDGQTGDSKETEAQLRAAAYEPIFWQFMGIGESRRVAQSQNTKKGLFAKPKPTPTRSGFEFLESLDEMSNRYVDNANFFSVADPETLPDTELYENLMGEYPQWVREAPKKGLLR